MTATRTIEDYVNLERCVDALEDERLLLQGQFRRETLRTSELSVVLREWVRLHESEHTPGVWSRGCQVCNLVKRSRELLGRPINAPHPQVGGMVDRFLSWPLPKGFAPDCGISFDGRKDDEWNKNKTWPIGTNLFSADQAREMIEHLLGADSLVIDAERYRFVRTADRVAISNEAARDPIAYDAAIDAAIAKAKP